MGDLYHRLGDAPFDVVLEHLCDTRPEWVSSSIPAMSDVKCSRSWSRGHHPYQRLARCRSLPERWWTPVSEALGWCVNSTGTNSSQFMASAEVQSV